MNKQDIIKLVKTEYQKDKYGVQIAVEIETEVFASVQSVSAKEFHEAGLNGMKPIFRFDIYSFEYSDEKIIIYQGKRYAIYRTYKSRLDIIELYVQEEVGV